MNDTIERLRLLADLLLIELSDATADDRADAARRVAELCSTLQKCNGLCYVYERDANYDDV